MDNGPAENTEVEENGTEVSQFCLGLPTVLRKILEHFCTKELIQLSLVNKQWNFEARSVLRDRGTLRAKIFNDEIRALGVFASDLQQMNVVPYSGILLGMSHPSECTSSAKESLDSICKAIVGRLPCKHLEVSLEYSLNCHRGCAAFALGKKICKGYCGVLQELTLNLCWGPDVVVKHFRNIIQDSEFPRLKTLNMKGTLCDKDGSTAKFLKFLVSCAPNLQEITFDGPIKFETNILEGSSAVLVPSSEFSTKKEDVCESLIGALRAKRMVISNVELINRYIPMVLEASCTSLKILQMELFFLVPLMCYGICLENVTELTLYFDSDSLRDVPPRVLKVLEKFDFTRVFPKLTAVTVRESREHFSPDRISGFVERGHAVLRNALPDRAISIQHLNLLSSKDSGYNGPLVAQMFPNVKTLRVRTMQRSYPYPFALIWEHFANLEELDISVHQWTWRVKPKAGDFCGIFPEEVAELMEKDEEYLKAVNIVPVMPSIRNMTNLRIFKLDLWTNDRKIEDDEITSFNKVTGLIGFARCPALAVTLKMN